MCGITGFFSLRTTSEQAEARLQAMLLAIQHRGPDDGGIWHDQDQGIAFGHRRLSILDLSPTGHQPMLSQCNRYVLIFNGEIYNHLELRRQLGDQVHWRGSSDTETLLRCMSDWGLEAALAVTVGMFALAVWDRSERSLFLARDRMGEKPLYYGWQKNSLLFGSELKALRAHPDFDGKVNWAAASSFLRLNHVPSPATIHEGVHKLPPGTFIRLRQGDLASRHLPLPIPYWSLGEAAVKGAECPFSGSFEEAVDELAALVKNAVHLQSVADVPVGAFLSGGIDSSLVVAMMKSSAASEVTTFSIGMPDARLDESRHAAAVAKHLGTRHIAHVIQAKEALDLIPKLPEIWDEPLGDSSQIPTCLVSRLAKQQVKVALSGDGGDELFLGYPQYVLYQKIWRSRFLGKLPLLRAGADGGAAWSRKWQLLLNAWRQPDPQALCRYWMDRYRQGVIPLADQVGLASQPMPLLPDAASTGGLWDAATYLPDDILVKVDRASMYTSLETRAPLLDHRIVEFAQHLPLAYKLRHGGVGKNVLRSVLYRHVPRHIIDRPKMGFSIPIQSWLKKDLRPWAEELIADIPHDSQTFKKHQVLQLWNESLAGQNHSEKLWGLLSLLSFLRFNKIAIE
ncbi:asparagine synthase (glutamine-hydrolyzing) [Aquabacterium sp.]|uniref:asparagine synthase (glutamine-hydrolyzing) n=1 Tax=Aquabacterium sp. TaxID=1872578 RepID=UPI003D6D3B76